MKRRPKRRWFRVFLRYAFEIFELVMNYYCCLFQPFIQSINLMMRMDSNDVHGWWMMVWGMVCLNKYRYTYFNPSLICLHIFNAWMGKRTYWILNIWSLRCLIGETFLHSIFFNQSGNCLFAGWGQTFQYLFLFNRNFGFRGQKKARCLGFGWSSKRIP